MKQTTTRLMRKDELERVNPKIIERFGATKVIESGSVVESGEGISYYIVVREYHTTYPECIKKLGKIVKDTLNAKKVYCSGIQIA